MSKYANKILGPNGLPLNTIRRVTEYPIIPREQLQPLVDQLQEVLATGQPASMPWGVPGEVLLSMASSLVHYANLANAVTLPVPGEE